MHTVTVTFKHHATMLGMVDLFKPAVEALIGDRLTGASAFGTNTTTRLRMMNRERFYAHLALTGGAAVTLTSIVDLANPIAGAESLDLSEHTLIVTVSDRVDALNIAAQVLDLLGPETIDEPKGNAEPFDPGGPDCETIASNDGRQR